MLKQLDQPVESIAMFADPNLPKRAKEKISEPDNQ